MKNLLLLLVCLSPLFTFSQGQKILGPDDYDVWKEIDQSAISPDGEWITHTLQPYGNGNPSLHLSKNPDEDTFSYTRGRDGLFTYDSKFLVFTIEPDFDEWQNLRRIKTKDEMLPRDTLAIYDLNSANLTKYAGVKSLKVPEKWSGYIAYQLHPPADTTDGKKPKKWKKDGGYPLVIRSTTSDESWEFPFVTDYVLSEKGGKVAFITKGDSTLEAGAYAFDTDSRTSVPLVESKGKFYNLSWDESGEQLAFVLDGDTTEALQRQPDLIYWQEELDTVKVLTAALDLADDHLVSVHFKNYFSKDRQRLFFGWAEQPAMQDTSLLAEEIVNVEVWTHHDQRLHTQQQAEKGDDAKSSYLAAIDPGSGQVVKIADPETPEANLAPEGNGSFAVVGHLDSYLKYLSWEGFPLYQDVYSVNLDNGERRLIKKKLRASEPRISPGGKYAFWYSAPDSAWFSYSFEKQQIFQLTTNETVPFYREIHDTPSLPSSYGIMSWTEDDQRVLIYDRYDIWEIHPENGASPVNLTENGRTGRIRYRYQRADREERFIRRNQPLIIAGFNEADKSEALYAWAYGKKGLKKMMEGPYDYSSFIKALESDDVYFERENFRDFPNLHRSTLSLRGSQQVTDANPQQADYRWGNAEIYRWTSLDGRALEGMLIKPDDFDPSKKYPMIVNFYEKSSDGLHRHRPPSPGRSSVSYSMYVSKGYVIFNPDVYYREGYPGESAYNCVVPGVTSLIEEGFIDPERIGAQGHSWGGYQISYLITKTDLFACVEAGAPVVNMTSAYGGIRWGSGLSRMFQYERTQSRIGGTLWEYPLRYIENSPLFFADKVNTPIMYMHNDADTAVPWYQGIEFFVALRRLNKPVWMLNYQGEPHGIVKKQNRIDFQTRMSQFFDYYLLDQPMPAWMAEGIPAREVGIDLRLGPAEDQDR